MQILNLYFVYTKKSEFNVLKMVLPLLSASQRNVTKATKVFDTIRQHLPPLLPRTVFVWKGSVGVAR